MTKKEFIEILEKHAKTSGVFGNRFVPISEDGNIWKYNRPAIDILEPLIDLSTEGFVIYHPNIGFGDKTSEEISYEDFITKYNLTRE
jgi:hypothetical protein